MAKKRKQRRISKDDVDANSGSDDTSDECENRRGRTVLKIVGRAIKNETKIPVQWSRNKVPTGDNRETFANYIGVVVRERVSINYREWDDVPQDKIDEVYHFITKGFEVPDEHKGYVLRKAGVQWRTFKARLRRDWMYDSKGENKNQIIRKPPSKYSWIDQDQWDKFIEASTDPKFKELSELNRERAKRRVSRYRGGRKGYIYYEQELAQELRKQKVPLKDVPRHLVWIRAHSRQEGDKTYFDNPADFEVAQAIKALEAQQIRGEIDATGRNDILGRALKTPEHGGSVRGVGSCVTNKQYFGYNKPTPSSQLQIELDTVKSQLADVVKNHKLLLTCLSSGEINPEQLKQLAIIPGIQVSGDSGGGENRLSNYDSGDGHYQGLQDTHFQLCRKSDLGGFNGNDQSNKQVQSPHCQLPPKKKKVQRKDLQAETYEVQEKEVQTETYRVAWPEPKDDMLQNDTIVTDQPFPKGVDSLCSLAIENETWVHIAAVGEVYVPNEGEVVKHHCKPVPSGYFRVCIREEIIPTALLPCPEGEMKFICQGKGNFFIWPGHLIFPIQKENEQASMEFNSTHSRSPSSQTSNNRKYTITHADKSKVTTSLLQVFKDVAIGMKKNGKTKSFTIPSKVFQIERCLTLDYEDMLDWCFQRMIGSSHISILMMYLSDMVHTEGISGLYGFCDSNYLSPLTPMENEDDRSDYLSRVFVCNNGKNKNQLFFAPYHEGLHWMLAVICPWVGLVHWLDPAGGENEPREFAQNIINKGIIKFSMEHRKDISKMKKNPYIKWKKIECPRQPLDTNDCGYYVCRYMIEIIESRQLFVPDKYFDKVPSTYSQQMIDELREVWISYVTENHQSSSDDDDDLLEL